MQKSMSKDLVTSAIFVENITKQDRLSKFTLASLISKKRMKPTHKHIHIQFLGFSKEKTTPIKIMILPILILLITRISFKESL